MMKHAQLRKKDRRRFQKDSTDPVEVYCRIRPVPSGTSVCVKRVTSNTVRLVPPPDRGDFRGRECTFRYVFDEESRQNEVFEDVELPLVRDLLQGKNGLLFTYGITSSGKTHTMLGPPEDPGILPRTLDVVFNSLNPSSGDSLLADPCTFKPDKMNGFEVLDGDSRQRDYFNKKTAPRTEAKRARGFDTGFINRTPLTTVIEEVDRDCAYAVFITFVEIYNKYAFDLLMPEFGKNGSPPSRTLHEDSRKKVFVSGVTEIEVRNANEALEILERGMRNRQVAATQLNPDSSRSHAIFNIRLVQAPLDENGRVMVDNDVVAVSQLSLVDLAGSERIKRTKNEGLRLREAGNINVELMTLRNCLDVLRSNQMKGEDVPIPYRESKLTQLFKSYFEGDGKVRMIVCLNPAESEYRETEPVLQFAEATQDIMVERSQQVRHDNLGLQPGRRAVAAAAAEQRRREAEEEIEETITTRFRSEYVSEQRAAFVHPNFLVTDPSDTMTLPALAVHLENRIKEHKATYASCREQEEAFVKRLRQLIIRSRAYRVKIDDLKEVVREREDIIHQLQGEIHRKDEIIKNLLKHSTMSEEENMRIMSQVHEKDYRETYRKKHHQEKDLTREAIEKERVAKRQRELKRKDEEVAEATLRANNAKKLSMTYEEKLKRVVHAVQSNEEDVDWATPSAPPYPSSSNASSHQNTTRVQQLQKSERANRVRMLSPAAAAPENQQRALFVNTRYGLGGRRSRSTDRFVEHTSKSRTPVGTCFRPAMKRRKSVTKLDLEVTKRSSNYLLEHQTTDGNGNLATQLYKGDIIPTAGGGRAVIFKDVETLQQSDPVSFSETIRHRSDQQMTLSMSDVAERCAVHRAPTESSPRKDVRRVKI